MSSDRLTELQNQISELTFKFYTFLGIIQRDSPSVSLDTQLNHPPDSSEEDLLKFDTQTKDFAVQIAKSSRAIHDVRYSSDFPTQSSQLIQSLPGSSSTEEEQVKEMERLEEENQVESDKLKERVDKAEEQLNKIREMDY
ncbi:Srb7p: RNA polymerase II holoenzyme component [Planoprotostelium fungivorum]|uniref:Mediator of RNA polymerase II transcription subunit 21 n=1 Tax=Planoprotostelium fungivorum TaxID=1890364 RepID=A0A2P6N3R4_9EUKA|nr:Srb7p: RNA polymerase II holoenzyme component [Planoprotostelium fungivorum]